MALSYERLIGTTRRFFRGTPNMARVWEDIVDRLVAVEGATYGDDIAALTARVDRNEIDIGELEDHSPLEFIGSQSALSVAATATNTFIDWPGDLHNIDVYLALGDINGRFAQLLQGAEIAGIAAAAVGDTLVTTAGSETGVPLYALNNATNAARALIGKTAAGDVLIQGAAADTTSVLVLYRVAGA